MANRRRYYRPRRRERNYTWQPWYLRHTTNVTESAGERKDGLLATFVPGVGDTGDPNNIEAFKDDHVLERIRGGMCHIGRVSLNPSGNTWFPYSLAFLKIPAGFAGQAINLFDNADGDDFLFRHDVVCRAQNAEAVPNWHNIDSKAKRKFETGDSIAILYSLISPTNTDFSLDLVMNFRMLWSLKV